MSNDFIYALFYLIGSLATLALIYLHKKSQKGFWVEFATFRFKKTTPLATARLIVDMYKVHVCKEFDRVFSQELKRLEESQKNLDK